MRVLVAEDEVLLADALAEGLRQEAIAADVAYDGSEALQLLDVNDYDVLILDRDLPLVHGDDVCRALVDLRLTTRILMLTAASEVEDRVAGLSMGADDYLPKPFAFAEFVARVRALARRARPAAPPVLRRRGIELDPARRQVSRDGRFVALSRKEFGVLQELLLVDGAAVSTERLLEKVWDEHVDPMTNVVRVTVMTLRRKLGPPQVVETVNGVGYQVL